MGTSESKENRTLGVAMISPDLKVLAINHRMKEWYPALDIGEHPLCYRVFRFPPREKACRNCPVVKTLEDGQSHESEMEISTPEGVRNFRIVAPPLTASDGRITQ